MRPEPIKTTDGFRVTFSSFEIHETYAGVLEGSAETVTKMMRETRELEGRSEDYAPTLVLDPGGPAFPDYTIRARFESHSTVHDPEQYCSLLNVCWFRDDIDATPAEMAAAALREVEWRTHARDGSWG